MTPWHRAAPTFHPANTRHEDATGTWDSVGDRIGDLTGDKAGRRVWRDICLAMAAKLVLLVLLYAAFFSSGHRRAADTGAYLFDVAPPDPQAGGPQGQR
jgi:hypothetical protein